MNKDTSAHFYNQDASNYDERWRSPGGKHTTHTQLQIVEHISGLVGPLKGTSVLEVGPGSGRFSHLLLKQGVHLTLLDQAEKMLSATRTMLQSELCMETATASFVQGSVYELPFQNDQFDLAVSINVFNHLEDSDRALSELARTIKPGGHLIFNYANALSLYLPAAAAINITRRAYKQDVYSHWTTRRRILRGLQRAGLHPKLLVGNTHVPRALEHSVLLRSIASFDRVARRGPLRHLAPIHFLLCEKP